MGITLTKEMNIHARRKEPESPARKAKQEARPHLDRRGMCHGGGDRGAGLRAHHTGEAAEQYIEDHYDAVAEAVTHPIFPVFETLHRLAGNPEVNLRDDDPTGQPGPSDDRPLAESVRQFGVLCYTLHVLQEQATRNFNSDYHPHQTVVAGSELLRSLACLAFQVEPYFSEPKELEARAQPLLPELLPAINPITAEDFPKD